MSIASWPTNERDPAWHGVEILNMETDLRDDPYPAFHHLRRVAPVNETPIGIWRLTRHADCQRLLREVPCGVRPLDGTPPLGGEDRPGDFMLLQDPPNHTRLRKLVSKAFTPRAVAAWKPRAEALVKQLLDEALARPSEPDGSVRLDAIADLALPVPARLICEMMGVPIEDVGRFTAWTADATQGLTGVLAAPDVRKRALEASDALADYFRALIEARRGRASADLVGILIEAEEEGDRLSPEELMSQCIGLLIAGFETTIGLIGNGLAALARHPDEQERWRRDPSLGDNAVEELLRFEGPIALTVRYLHEDAEFGGRTLPRGAQVWPILWAANRDPEKFDDPDRLDLARPDASEHLAFGGGPHLCLGTHLARLEARTAIGGLLARTASFELESDVVEWGRSLFRVPAALPLRARVR